MSKERLEDIKHEYGFLGVIHRSEHIEWLIEQAERVQELEGELYGNDIQMGYKRMYGECNRDYAKLLQQNKRYREALEEIKKEETVTTALSEGQVAYTISGHIARKALEE